MLFFSVEKVSLPGEAAYDYYPHELISEFQITEITVNIGKHRIICTEYLNQYKDGDGKQTTFYILSLLWNKLVPVDHFRVKDCKSVVMIKETANVIHKFGILDELKRLEGHIGHIVFKGSGQCYTRGYVIEIFEFHTTVERSKPSVIGINECIDPKVS